MATDGPNSPSTIVSDSSIGTVAWSNPGNAGASDDSRAEAALDASEISEYLKATNFGFSIPAGATIDGIEVSIEKQATSASRVQDEAVRIVKGGVIGATDKSIPDSWDTADVVVDYGGPADLWGETWSESDINASDFGVAIAAESSSNSQEARVDHITITITYTAAAAGHAHKKTQTRRLFSKVGGALT